MRWLVGSILATAGCGLTESSEGPTQPAPASEPVAEEAKPAASWSHFGAPFTLASAVEATEVFADPAQFSESPVRVRGELTEVCQKMGCWAVLRDDEGRSMRVTMKAHGFGIEPTSRGHECDAEGTLVKKEVDPERIAHFKSEGSRTNPEEGHAEVWELVATSVRTRPQ